MTNAPEYPEYVKDIINKDILRRDSNDHVRIAYQIALQLHKGQKRKGIDKPDYITHPLQVYDLTNRCLLRNIANKDVALAAALLHDGIEDYKQDEIKAGTIPAQEAREEAVAIIRSKFSDDNFTEKLLFVLNALTNPVEFRDKNGNPISKTEWQVQNIRTATPEAKLIKICDKTMNIASSVEEVPNWNYEELLKNAANSKQVVAAAKENTLPHSPYNSPITLASKIYTHVAEGKIELLNEMLGDGREIPPKTPIMSFSFQTIINMIRSEEQEKQRF